MSKFLTDLLEFYNISVKDLSARKAPGSFVNLNLPYDLPDFVKVVNRIKESISKHEKVVVYGDYDVDGLTSTAIMVKTLLQLGLKSGYFIPSRYHEGYGLCISRVEDFIKKGYQTIITVDNGISAFEAIDYAKSKGLEVIVIDHHEIQEKLPNTDYIFHQNLSGFIDYNCSAASLAFFVCSYLLGGFDYYLATMAGIAVFSDVMPLIGNNLELAKISLFAMKKFRYPNLISLNTSDEISYDYYSFVLIPSLNSVGRILTDTLATNAACKFLIYPDQPDLVDKISQFLISTNEERKNRVRQAKVLPQFTLESEHGAVVRIEEVNGLCGLIANFQLNQFHKAYLVCAPDTKCSDNLVGSVRLPDGYDITKFLADNSKYFLAAGGHSQAAGLTFASKDYYQVATLFLTECEKQGLNIIDEQSGSIGMSLEDLNSENFAVYESFKPFGQQFPSPVFEITVDKDQLSFSQKGNAVFAFSESKKSKIVYFGLSEPFTQERYSSFSFYGQFSCETYNSKTSYVLKSNKYIANID